MKYEKIYKSLNLLSDLSEEKWLSFCSLLTEHQFAKNETILPAGSSKRYIHIIVEGVARNYYLNQDGREYTKLFRGPNELIGPYMEVLAGVPSKYVIQSITKTKTLSFSYPDLLSHITDDLQWQKIVRQIAEQNFLEKERREFMLIHMNLEEKYSMFLEQFAHLKDQIPQYQVASYLGVTAESLNRFLRKN